MARHPISNESACRGAVARAIREGRLSAEPAACEACGAAGHRSQRVVLPRRDGSPRLGRWSLVWHHHSYEPEFWLDVVAVCDACHTRIHLGQIPEPRTGELRTGGRRKPTNARPYVPHHLQR